MVDGEGGSASANQGGTPPVVVEPKNKTAKMSMDQAYAEIQKLQKENKDLAETIADLTEHLNEANKVLESQEKGRLIGEILPRSSFKVDDLTGKSVDDLKNIRGTLDLAMPPRVNSVRFGVHGGDLSDREKGYTVGDISIVTAAKRKAA
jgi:predicted ribosome quality control (RQC) complex YloA/Tae2 family protein